SAGFAIGTGGVGPPSRRSRSSQCPAADQNAASIPDAAVRNANSPSIGRGRRHRRSPSGVPSHATTAPSACAGRFSISGRVSGSPKRAAVRSSGLSASPTGSSAQRNRRSRTTSQPTKNNTVQLTNAITARRRWPTRYCNSPGTKPARNVPQPSPRAGSTVLRVTMPADTVATGARGSRVSCRRGAPGSLRRPSLALLALVRPGVLHRDDPVLPHALELGDVDAVQRLLHRRLARGEPRDGLLLERRLLAGLAEL